MLSIGTLKSFNSTDYRAEVQLAGSITAYLDNIPVARNIAANQMVTGRHVLVAIPEDNPKDAIVLSVWGSSGPSFGDHGELAGLGDDDHTQYLKEKGSGGLASEIPDHASGHEFLGADSLDLMGLLAELIPFFGDWRTKDSVTDYKTGSGTVEWAGMMMTKLKTGTTQGSHAAEYTGDVGQWVPAKQNQHSIFLIEGDGFENSACTIRFYLVRASESLPPSDISRHVGWKVKNKRIWATCGDGTAETEVDTGVDLDGTYPNKKLHTVGSGPYGGPNTVYFYINGVLKATISTNIYTASWFRAWMGIVNNSTIDQRIRANYFGYLFI